MWAKGWCPKQIGFFPGGRLDEFVHGHRMSGDTEGRQPEILADVGKCLARFHSLDYFFRKDQYDAFFATPGYDTFKATHPFWQDENHRKAWQSGFEYNYKKEIEWIRWAFAQIACPKSRWHMIHCDINMGNWIVLDRPYRNYDLKVMLIDYELGCWGPRGHDLGGYFMIRMMRSGVMHYRVDEVFYPEEDEMSMLASAYIREMQKLKPEWCNPERDSIPNVIREMELGIIAYSLSCAFQSVVGAERLHTFDDGSRGAYTGVLNLFLNFVPDEIVKPLKEKWCKKYGFPPEIPTKP
jgi:thiamine kinase-like enzyme